MPHKCGFSGNLGIPGVVLHLNRSCFLLSGPVPFLVPDRQFTGPRFHKTNPENSYLKNRIEMKHFVIKLCRANSHICISFPPKLRSQVFESKNCTTKSIGEKYRDSFSCFVFDDVPLNQAASCPCSQHPAVVPPVSRGYTDTYYSNVFKLHTISR